MVDRVHRLVTDVVVWCLVLAMYILLLPAVAGNELMSAVRVNITTHMLQTPYLMIGDLDFH